jgi:glutamate dehydrogenase
MAQLMEERRDRGSESVDPPALARLLSRLRDRVSAPEQPQIEAFGRALFAKASPILLDSADFEPLIGMSVSAFRFLCRRGSEPIALRSYLPEKERDGWSSAETVVEAVLDDRPFIVDTLCETLRAEGGEIRQLLHPVLGVRRDASGVIERIGPPSGFSSRESFFHAEVTNLGPSPNLEQLLAARLRQVLLATDDYRAMRGRVEALAAELRSRPLPSPWGEDAEEVAALLDWLGRKNFVYLGYREYQYEGSGGARRAVARRGSGLGILRDEARSRYRTPQRLDEALQHRFAEPALLRVSKTNAKSPIHRIAPMDDISIPQVDAGGTVVGERRLLGLFTSKACHEPPSDVPVLRRQLEALLRLEGAVEDSHDFKDVVSLFNSIPKEELFARRLVDLRELVHQIVSAQVRSGLHLFCRADALRRGLFATVILPRARFSTELNQRVESVLRQNLGAAVLQEHVALDERPQVRLHYHLAVPPAVLEQPPVAGLERDLAALLRTWDDELRDRLGREYAAATADRLAATYQGAFPPEYKAGAEVADAVRDIRCLEALIATGRSQVELSERRSHAAPTLTALKLYSAGEALVLSDFIPVLENLGLRVFGEDFVDLTLSEPAGVRIRTFFVQPAFDPAADIACASSRLVPALQALRAGRVENDRLNTLVLRAELDWRAVEVLRTYVEHARQVGLAPRTTLVEALTEHPESAAGLFRFFAAKFDPDASSLPPAERESGPAAEALADFLSGLDRVASLVHDRALRTLADTVAATVRTTFYRRDLEAPEANAVAIKIHSARLAHLPQPKPLFETYVHAPYMEGVHLRAGRVARGGIRLSDRPDDFRSEVLELMKTQVVKNAVIVPVGAKGGFILKGRQPAGPPAAELAECAYRTLIGALLAVTDNIAQGRATSPRSLLVYDEPDPYLVVAADKGTATYSDVANEIAGRYGYWLGDAFASGGSHGYDHKRLGITARGAWECVRQHFREIGRDVDREPLSVVGIGDMSGDVFGNGMLRSRTIRLRAAFNHRHILLDPEPDPERSFAERARLFHLPHSSWNDYDPSCLSAGGGVFPRAAKSIDLAPEARSLLGTAAQALSGEDVVRAILRMEADLLWNGGIGTYVKASGESNADVGDPANDRVRVEAKDLRVRVVAEGGNLGFTQAARVEFALAGGRINTDAIDNSGGVDCSDHEVNLKIALQPALLRGEISAEQRNRLLSELADDVCESVLAHNRRQALTLTLDQVRSRSSLASFRDLLGLLEAEAGLDRHLECLPTREALRARRGAYLGLTRPELAVLLAFSKLHLQHRIRESSLCDEPEVERYLRDYFPPAIDERFAHAVEHHSLRREIIAVELANRLVDSMGMTFLARVSRDTGRGVPEIVTAWTAAMAVSAAEDLLRDLWAARRAMTAEAEQVCHVRVELAVERSTKWIIESLAPFQGLGDLTARFREPVAELLETWAERLSAGAREIHAAEIETLIAQGVEAGLAARLVRLGVVDDALEISHLAMRIDAPPPRVAEAYLRTVELADLDWVRRSLPETVAGDGRWEQRAIGGLLEGLLYARRQLTVNVLASRPGASSIDECLARYATDHHAQLATLGGLIDDLKAASKPTLPGLLVVMRELGRLTRA